MNLRRRLDRLELNRADLVPPSDLARHEKVLAEIRRQLEWAFQELNKPRCERHCRDETLRIFRGLHRWISQKAPPTPARDHDLEYLTGAIEEMQRVA
jgi:hypothetical protein